MASRRERLRRHTRHRTSAGAIVLRVAIVAVVLVVVSVVSSGAFALAVVDEWLKGLPDIDHPGAFAVALPTRIYSADGKLIANLYLENREVIPLNRNAVSLRQAVVAVEDERFYKHRGWDPEGVARAVYVDLVQGKTQGASTITQQYVRNTVLISEKNVKSLQRKVREMYLASEVEKRFSKDQILNMYLNTVYFGEGAYGTEAASLTFFGKRASQLTLGESALIAGLAQSPSRYSPYDNMKAARTRQAEVLTAMVRNGYVSRAEADKAARAPLKLHRISATTGIYQAPYFVAYVKKLLQQKYGSAVLFKGGLRVYTTLETRMQDQAESAVRNALSEPDDPDTALVAIDPTSGAIKAMVGGHDYAKHKFNYATQGKRQPGSSFKAFVLTAAIEKRIPPYRAIDSGSPAEIPAEPEPWIVSNSEGKGSGFISIETATWHSVNTVFARLIHEIGPAYVRDLAMRMGIKTKLPAYDSIALGTIGVTPLEMASAYGTLANQGVHNEPMSITKVVAPNGKVIFAGKPTRERVLARSTARAVTTLLGGVISQGTGTAADIGRPEAGKTGTSQNYRDAWFVGYTPQLVTAVWVGYGGTERSMTDVHGIRVFGGTYPAEIWATFMSAALESQPTADFADAPDPDYTWQDDWKKPYDPAAKKPDPANTDVPVDPNAPVDGTGGGPGNGSNPDAPPPP
jgi:1A family penicillin-binding protein